MASARCLHWSKILQIHYCFVNPLRLYTIQPPEWLGGKNMLTVPDRHEFPEHEKTFEQRIRGML